MAKAIRRQNHPKCQYDGKCARAASHILLTKHGDFHLCTKHTKDVQEWSGVRYVEKIRPDNSKRNPHEVSFACENCNHVFTIDSDYWIPPRTYTDRYQCPKCLKKHATVVMYKIQWLKKNPGKAYHLDRFYKLDKDRLFTEFHNLHELNNRVMGAVEEAGKSARMSGATDYEVSEYRRRATRDFKGYRNPVYGYIGFYKGKQFEVYASSSLEAQTKIAKEQKVKKPWEITVVLAEKEGKPVTHLPLFNPTDRWKGRKKNHEWMIVAQQYTPSYREFYHCELCNKYEDSDGKRYTAAQFKGIMKTQELYQPDCRIRLNPLGGLGGYIVAGLGFGTGSVIAHDIISHAKKSVKSKK